MIRLAATSAIVAAIGDEAVMIYDRLGQESHELPEKLGVALSHCQELATPEQHAKKLVAALRVGLRTATRHVETLRSLGLLVEEARLIELLRCPAEPGRRLQRVVLHGTGADTAWGILSMNHPDVEVTLLGDPPPHGDPFGVRRLRWQRSFGVIDALAAQRRFRPSLDWAVCGGTQGVSNLLLLDHVDATFAVLATGDLVLPEMPREVWLSAADPGASRAVVLGALPRRVSGSTTDAVSVLERFLGRPPVEWLPEEASGRVHFDLFPASAWPDFMTGPRVRACVLAAVRAPVVSNRFVGARYAAFDHTTPLPPFVPTGDPNALVWSAAVEKIAGPALVAHLPAPDGEAPEVGVTEDSSVEILAETVRMTSLPKLSDAEVRMSMVAERLHRLRSLPTRRFAEHARLARLQSIGARVARLERLQVVAADADAAIAERLERAEGDLHDAAHRNFGDSHVELGLRRLFERYANLLDDWPSIIRRARELAEGGRRLSEGRAASLATPARSV